MRLYPSDPDIETIVKRIVKGKLNLQPDFQRGEVWNISKKQKLIDSILRGWYIPPIHIVDTNSNYLEVLDGQQRLATIRDFALNKFKIDGKIDPFDEKIMCLDGLYYNSLPDEVRNRFDEFSLRFFTISDYLPSEPSELFYRLNQITSLTPAEQRNAFYGKAREQVKDLVSTLKDVKDIETKMGFSSSRMNYDEVIARFLVYIENNTLSIKVTSNALTNIYRDEKGFSYETIEQANIVINFFASFLRGTDEKFKFNKATLLTWLLFIYRSIIKNLQFVRSVNKFEELIRSFEVSRKSESFVYLSSDKSNLIEDDGTLKEFFKIFNDRSSSRVADVSSVQLRDFILFIYAFSYYESDYQKEFLEFRNKYLDNILLDATKTLEDQLLFAITSSNWSDYN